MQNLKLYKIALSFNNKGIYLLENRFYEDSIFSFQQAVYCMNGVFTCDAQSNESESYSENLVRNDVDLHFNTVTSKIIQIRLCRIQPKYDDITFSVVTDEKTVSQIFFEAAHSAVFDDTLNLVRIDDMEGEIDFDDANVHLEASIILSNLAAACRASALIGLKNGRESVFIQLMTRSRRFYTHAYHILSEAIIFDEMEIARSILVSMFILAKLIQCTLNRTDRRAYHIKLYDFRSELSMFDWIIDAYEKDVKFSHIAAAA